MFSVTSVFSDARSSASVMPNCCSSHGESRATPCPTRSGRRCAASTTSACTSGISTRNSASKRTPNSSTTTVVASARADAVLRRPVDERRAEVREDRADEERREHRAQVAQAEEDDDRRAGDPDVVARREHPARTRPAALRRRLGERIRLRRSRRCDRPARAGGASVISGRIRRVKKRSRQCVTGARIVEGSAGVRLDFSLPGGGTVDS